ncbi:MAG: DUF1997 domain-containing protein [Cyanobacteria bacterium]|nr:DUF1997 domain-containing protein [Cyanobacteria bacterium CG_2015-16_32_12]NCO77313.1 DUF1997 domain-containing protein [Cyanobacteria bacterium CG_2015-22_32_23]NCQ05610.1 DUF1997 domain-containing protein [Cyanobacteria bacterium CG_2015-09_32_10]NCQ41420.1 DUF1997 domain-containing protein [Cyanobacteria bacterium CG_2015-04_32_10]NCS86152.1 DUF1997 domain-containing protein [Cyanobacteria bacterium CG_2015-02_32_10]
MFNNSEINFQAEEIVNLEVQQQIIPIQHYLRQPFRLVKAIADEKLLKILGNDLYQLQMKPLNFLEIYHFQPSVILKVWTGASGNVYLKSESCEIKGIEYINRRFSLDLKGKLTPVEIEGKICLQGRANLTVKVDLPPPLWLTPKAILQTTGNSLLKGVLMRIKHQLMSQLLQDYYSFAQGEKEKISHPQSILKLSET